MSCVLNIVAALLLTVLPALRPCDCKGFSFICGCAFSAREKGVTHSTLPPPAAGGHASCCCGHSRKPVANVRVVENSQQHPSEPTQPAPRKHGGCQKFAAVEMQSALLQASIGAPMALTLAIPVFPALHVLRTRTSMVQQHGQRPPPLGLVYAETQFLRI